MTRQRAEHASADSGFHDVLLIVWIALIGADRIDILGGHGPFVFTPYLALTPVVLASELLRRHFRQRPLRLAPQASAFLVVALLLLSVVGASVFVSQDVTKSASRAALLMLHLAGSLAVLLAASDRGDLNRVFEVFARLADLLVDRMGYRR